MHPEPKGCVATFRWQMFCLVNAVVCLSYLLCHYPMAHLLSLWKRCCAPILTATVVDGKLTVIIVLLLSLALFCHYPMTARYSLETCALHIILSVYIIWPIVI